MRRRHICNQPVANQQAMTLPPESFGTHHDGRSSLCEIDQLGHSGLKLVGQHVIGEIAKARISQSAVGWSAPIAGFRRPRATIQASCRLRREGGIERTAIEVWMLA